MPRAELLVVREGLPGEPTFALLTTYQMHYREALTKVDVAEYNLLRSLKVQLDIWPDVIPEGAEERSMRNRALLLGQRLRYLEGKLNKD